MKMVGKKEVDVLENNHVLEFIDGNGLKISYVMNTLEDIYKLIDSLEIKDYYIYNRALHEVRVLTRKGGTL